MFGRILIAVDDSAPAVRAVSVGVELAEQLSATLAIMHVVDPSRAVVPEMGTLDDALIEELRREGEATLAAACGRAGPAVICERILEEGDPAEQIVATAVSWGADLVVLGSESRGRLAHFLLGSTADAVVRRALCPVMTVRADAVTSGSEGQLSAVAQR